MDEPPKSPDLRTVNALERAEAVQRFLAEAARRARFSARARGAYQKSSFAERRGAKAMRIAFLVLAIAMVAIPNVVGGLYYGLLASDQYVAEAKFTVSSAAIPKLDGLGSVTGLPQMMIFQDSMIIIEYIESRTLVEQLERQVNLRELYGSDRVDWWARFKKSKPIENFTEYWKKMATATISFPSGIVTLTVRAFSPADAKTIADKVIADCETLVNDLNERMRQDTVRASEQDVERAAERLKVARVNLERARNTEGLIDVRQTSKSQSEVLSAVQIELLKYQQEYLTQSRYVDESAPQIRHLKRQIESLEKQVASLKAEITTREQQGIDALASKTLSGKMTTFANLDLEHKIAETSYQIATASLDGARLFSDRKLLYLHQIEAPALPEDARYPRRWLYTGLLLAISLTLYGLVVGLIAFVRNHMA
ncbi:lipopolysaccharide biosynthesis protein [Methylosinus sp. R-45379]|uniref:lipopolysaccharide biosynthesis protein n=1 Tax=Methylosinus sp. R-45379 TaxID=980563 RepID=UPI0007C99406|nr:lipopolysaccharide biosynthesis protein [Methylosinus sp. R-45379]OAI23186.1 lipopolysaccharide biosynthesis protein [Methylosinus sp. R-45379]